jgi:hypothetical protein
MADLPKRTLGRTGLKVTTLGFGVLELQGKIRFLGCSSMLPHLTDHIAMGVAMEPTVLTTG